MEKYESQIISKLKVISLIGVIFIHAPQINGSILTNLLHLHIFSACVPVFFLISGYLVFRKPVEQFRTAAEEIKKRFSTLLLPFLIWNTLLLAIAIIANETNSGLQKTSAYAITDYDPLTILSAVFGFGRYPISYQFWFIRNLMLFILLILPMKQTIIKSPIVGIILAGILEQQISGALYFYIGGLISYYSNLSLLITRNPSLTVLAGISIFASGVLHPIHPQIEILSSLIIILGLANLSLKWKITTQLYEKVSSNTFFIYAAHEPVITLVEKLRLKFVVLPEATRPFANIIAPVTAILATWMIAEIIKRQTPKIYGVITGSR